MSFVLLGITFHQINYENHFAINKLTIKNFAMIMLYRLRLFLICALSLLSSCNPPQPETKETSKQETEIKRFGQVIRVKLEKLEYYKELHTDPWPCVLEKLSECNIHSYSIYLQDEYLFAYFEYTGSDFTADMAKMAADTCTQRWWKETDPCQEPIASATDGTWWTTMEEVFHTD